MTSDHRERENKLLFHHSDNFTTLTSWLLHGLMATVLKTMKWSLSKCAFVELMEKYFLITPHSFFHPSPLCSYINDKHLPSSYWCSLINHILQYLTFCDNMTVVGGAGREEVKVKTVTLMKVWFLFSNQRQQRVQQTVYVDLFDRPYVGLVWFSMKRKKNTSIMPAELQNTSCTGLLKKCMNERSGHGSVWINNERMNFLRAGGVHYLQDWVRRHSVLPSEHVTPVRMLFCVDHFMTKLPLNIHS